MIGAIARHSASTRYLGVTVPSGLREKLVLCVVGGFDQDIAKLNRNFLVVLASRHGSKGLT